MSSSRQLLVVDDEANIRRAIQRMCRLNGFELTLASNAEEALELLARQPFGVMLTDQMMPGMTGAELLERVKQDFPDVVRVMLTGYTALQGLTDAINNGAVFKILFKPWDDPQLLGVLNEAFALYEMRESNRRLTRELQELNASLAQKVEEKTRHLSLHIKRLEVSQALFELLPVLAVGITDDGMIVEANSEARAVFGGMGLVGMDVASALPPEVQTLLDSCMAAGKCHAQGFRITHQARTYELGCKPVRLASGASGCLLYGVQNPPGEPNDHAQATH